MGTDEFGDNDSSWGQVANEDELYDAGDVLAAAGLSRSRVLAYSVEQSSVRGTPVKLHMELEKEQYKLVHGDKDQKAIASDWDRTRIYAAVCDLDRALEKLRVHFTDDAFCAASLKSINTAFDGVWLAGLLGEISGLAAGKPRELVTTSIPVDAMVDGTSSGTIGAAAIVIYNMVEAKVRAAASHYQVVGYSVAPCLVNSNHYKMTFILAPTTLVDIVG